MISWLLSFETTTTSKLNLERIALSFESKRKRTVRSHKANDLNHSECPRESLVTARDFFGPGKNPESLRVLRETQLRAR